MRKSDKKIDNQLRVLLTAVCETALEDIHGFQWLTHDVNYSRFPDSLKIVCVFDNNDNLEHYLQSDNNQQLQSLIKHALVTLDITLKTIANHVLFDTEENCTQQHAGNWARRLKH